MSTVTGIGGVFFRCPDPAATRDWYAEHLGVPVDEGGYVTFGWGDDPKPDGGQTVWAPFSADTEYFGDAAQRFMVNFRTADLDGLLSQLAAAGVAIDPKREDGAYGRFAWITDCDGRRVELWEPPAAG